MQGQHTRHLCEIEQSGTEWHVTGNAETQVALHREGDAEKTRGATKMHIDFPVLVDDRRLVSLFVLIDKSMLPKWTQSHAHLYPSRVDVLSFMESPSLPSWSSPISGCCQVS